jgi:acylphosphatase
MAKIKNVKKDKVLAHAQGLQGEVTLFPEYVRILKKGAGLYFSHATPPDSDILIEDIASIQFKPTGRFSNGYIQFVLKGMPEAAQDKTVTVFTAQQEPEFEQFRDKLQQMLKAQMPQG